MKQLSGGPLLGRLLALQPNIGQRWDKHSSLLRKFANYGCKKFYNIGCVFVKPLKNHVFNMIAINKHIHETFFRLSRIQNVAKFIYCCHMRFHINIIMKFCKKQQLFKGEPCSDELF